MKYDDAEYFFLNFETDELENSAGATHIGMFLAWAMLRGLASPELLASEECEQIKARATTGCEVVVDLCDCKLFDSDLSPLGNAFASWYYDSQFFADYGDVFGVTDASTDEFCSVADTWANFDKLAPVLDRRFAKWRQEFPIAVDKS